MIRLNETVLLSTQNMLKRMVSNYQKFYLSKLLRFHTLYYRFSDFITWVTILKLCSLKQKPYKPKLISLFENKILLKVPKSPRYEVTRWHHKSSIAITSLDANFSDLEMTSIECKSETYLCLLCTPLASLAWNLVCRWTDQPVSREPGVLPHSLSAPQTADVQFWSWKLSHIFSRHPNVQHVVNCAASAWDRNSSLWRAVSEVQGVACLLREIRTKPGMPREREELILDPLFIPKCCLIYLQYST